ncbi:MAG TPA: RlmF-related methyltransferase, partial [Flavobacterium sp.]|nr:RlmF-related methyltransferase [Flavobacterium sp.]
AVYDWNFVATDIEQKSLEHAAEIIAKNERLSNKVTLRLQSNTKHILKGIVESHDYFEVVMCNPPFFKSKEEAETQTLRKLKGLNNNKQVKLIHNFSGQNNELWCNGGELAFLLTLINESVLFKKQVGWFTSLVSNEEHLKPLEKKLKKTGANYHVIQMAQGNKISRILAWQF